MKDYLLLVPAAGILALIYAFFKTVWIKKQDPGNEKVVKITGYIRQGAMAFLKAEYSVLVGFVIVIAILLGVSNARNPRSHALIALSFVIGAFCSALAGYIGMRVATLSNGRTASAAKNSLIKALSVAFSGGSVMGMCVVGLGLLGLGSLFIIYRNIFPDMERLLAVITGFSLGASSIALFARVGGGIYTKAADMGADLVGKVEAGIPEDDPRNPAVIADNVGDNVGDVAGMGADLFESYIGAIIGAMVLGISANWVNVKGAVVLPLFLAGAGVIASIVGTLFVKTKEDGDPQKALNLGTFISAFLMLVFAYFIIKWMLPADRAMGVFYATIAGLICGIIVGLSTEYYTSELKSPAQNIAHDSQTGTATNILSGIANGMWSTWLPLVAIAAAIVIASKFAGLYGIALAALGMLSTTGIQLSVDAYGPISDNAGGIAEMAELGPEVRKRTDRLDAVGNTTAAIGKGFAIGSAALTALALFAAFKSQVKLSSIDVSNPSIMAGIFIGATLPFVFSSMALRAVGKAAYKMIEEVRRQFKEIPGLLEGKAEADYARCVDISTKGAIKQMIMPGVLALLAPILVGFLGSKEMLGGLLVGVTVSGVLLAIFMANAGGAWDNAKKFIEAGNFGGKGSEVHKAAVVGDTVGDPFKDTAGPSLNILIKLISIIALVIAPLLS